MFANYPNLNAALEAGRPAGADLYRFEDGTYEWLTQLDADELASYGDYEFELVELTTFAGTLPTNPPAHVDTSEWDDPDNG